VRFEDFHPVGVEPFLTGFVARATPPRRGRGGRGRAGGRSPGRTGPAGSAGIVGRPVGLAVARDGALLVSDDEAGVIYRVSARP
jgi:hypothetical protein